MVNGIIIRVSGVQVPPPLPKIPIKYNKNNYIRDARISLGPRKKLSHTFTHDVTVFL